MSSIPSNFLINTQVQEQDQAPRLNRRQLNDLIIERCYAFKGNIYDRAIKEEFIEEMLDEIRQKGIPTKRSEEQIRNDIQVVLKYYYPDWEKQEHWTKKELWQEIDNCISTITDEQKGDSKFLKNKIRDWVRINRGHFPHKVTPEAITRRYFWILNNPLEKGSTLYWSGTVTIKDFFSDSGVGESSEAYTENLRQAVENEPKKESDDQQLKETVENKPKKGPIDHVAELKKFWRKPPLPEGVQKGKPDTRVSYLVDNYNTFVLEKETKSPMGDTDDDIKEITDKGQLEDMAKKCIEMYESKECKKKFLKWQRKKKFLKWQREDPSQKIKAHAGLFKEGAPEIIKASFLTMIDTIKLSEEEITPELNKMLTFYKQMLAEFFYQDLCKTWNIMSALSDQTRIEFQSMFTTEGKKEKPVNSSNGVEPVTNQDQLVFTILEVPKENSGIDTSQDQQESTTLEAS